jgi:DNA uptake protein ComE-like DNA-binding protein
VTRPAKPISAKPRRARPGRLRQAETLRQAAAPARFRGKAWLLLAVIPFGFTTWAAFVYIGIRARRPRWLAWAAVYAALLVGYLVLDTAVQNSNAADGAGAALALLAWIGGGAHAFAISGDAVRRIEDRADPALDAARRRIERRAEGRRLLATQPALAKEIGLGRPDISGADDHGLVDVNHASPAALAKLPGITHEVAQQIADRRAQAGGFSSVEDLGLVLDLPPGMIDQIRDTAIFIPD